MNPLDARICPQLIVALLLLVAVPAGLHAQDKSPASQISDTGETSGLPEKATNEAAAEPDGSAELPSSKDNTPPVANSARTPSPLAVPQWRGYTPRWIALYGSQLADLIPESFRPISISDLADALRDDSLQMQPASDVPVASLTVVAHIASENIVSTESQLVLPLEPESTWESSRDPLRTSWQRYRLGEMNLQLLEPLKDQQSATATETVQPRARILSGANGNCFAWGKPGSTIDFAWSVRGQHIVDGRRWTLQLPAATTTRLFLSVAKDENIVVSGGSATRLVQTPSWSDLGLDAHAVERLNADGSHRQEAIRWYSIEPTPGQPLVLTQRPSGQTGAATESMNIVRGCQIQSQWVGDQLRWTCRMTMDASSSFSFTELAWADGEVTAVRRDNVAIPFVWTGNTARWNEVSLDGTLDGAAPSGKLRMTSTMWVVEGVSRRRGDHLPLPRPLLPADRFIVPPQTWHLQLDLPAWVELSDVRLPPAWDLRRLPPHNTRLIDPANPESGGVDRVAADQHEPVVTWMASGPSPAPDDPWSVSVFSNDSMVFADHQMRFEMDESSIQVRGKVIVEMPDDAIGPITFDLQDGFQFEFIGVGEGRRSVATGTAAGHGRRLTIWPGGDEVVNNRVVVYVNGRARRTNIADRSELDPSSSSALISSDVPTQQPGAVASDADAKTHEQTFDSQTPPVDAAARENGPAAIGDESVQRTKSLWLMRAVDCPGQLLATIVPPAGLSWSAKAAIEPSRITIADLSAVQRRFFAPLPGDAIVFGGAIEATPEVSLEKPDVNLSVSLRTLLRTATRTLAAESTLESSREPDLSLASELPAPLWQTLEVKTEGTAGEIRTMRLRFAARPPQDHDGSPTRPDGPGTDKTTDDHPSESSAAAVDPPPWVPMRWFVQLQPGQAETPLAERAVRRHYVENAGDWEVRVDLPPLFTNQSILIGRRRLVAPVDRQAFAIGLPNVPDAASQSAEIWIDSSLQLNEHPETLKGVPVVDSSGSERSPASAVTSESGEHAFSPTSTLARYRYAPNDQPWVVVTPRTHQPPRGLIVNQRLFAKASVNGTDTLRMICLAKSSSEILLTFPPSMHLVDLRCDGQLVTPRRVPGRGVVITLPEPPPPPTSSRSATSRNEGPDGSVTPPNGPSMRSHPSAQNWRRLEMNWISQTPLSHWYRWYQFPEIEFDQMVVDSHFELSTANGTHLLQIPDFTRRWFSSSAPLLLQTGFIAGVGWVTALLLLALACLVSRRGLGILGSGILVTAVAVVLWPAAAIPLIAFVAVPLTLAALQRATALWHGRRDDDADDSEMNGDASSKQASHRRYSHAPNLLWWMTFTIFFLNSSGSIRHAVGQQISAPSFSAETVPDTRDNAGRENTPAPDIDVLVPLQSDGKILGNKIYVPEAFYNDLYFGDDRMPWHNPMIDRVFYHLRLKSPLDRSNSLLDTGTLFGNDSYSSNALKEIRPRDATSNTGEISDEMLSQKGIAVLQAKIQLTLPANVRRIRLPYQFDQIDAVTQLSAIGDPMTVRWGGESDVGAWVDIPALGRDFENVELLVSLRCQLHWQDPWVTVSCDLPRLPAANLVVTSNDAIKNVMLLTPQTSRFVALHASPSGSDVPAQTSSTSSVASLDSEARKSEVISLGSHRQLNLQFQCKASTATALANPAIGPRAPSDPDTESVTAIDQAILPWYDPTQWQQRYWVHSGSGKTVIECELESLQSLPPEVILQLATIGPQVIAVASDGNPSQQQSEKASTLQSPQPCVLLGRHWSSLPREDEPSAPSRDLRLVSLATPSQPIRLAWTLQTPNHGSWRIKMPRVWPQPSTDQSDRDAIASEADSTQPGGNRAASEPQPALQPWIAWSFASEVEPDWSTLVQSEPIAVDQFYAKWTGYLSSIDRATKGSVQELTVSRVSEASWSVDSRHEISIHPKAQRIHYTAHVTASQLTPRDVSVDAIAPSSPTVGATGYVIRLPKRARLLDWRFETEGKPPVSPLTPPPTLQSDVTQSSVQTVDPASETESVPSATTANGHSPIWTVSQKDGVTILYITTDRSSFDITVDAIVPHHSGKNANQLGLIAVKKISSRTSPQKSDDGENAGANEPGWADDVKQTNEVQITRDADTIIKWIHPATSPRIDTAVADAASLLADGEIVVDRFRAEGSIFKAFESVRFRAVTNDRPFDVDSRITLRWEEGRWTAQTDCRITSSYCPDYIDIAIPTRWCESLRIDPHCVSSRQPTLDPAMQVLRLQLRNDSAADGKSKHTRTFQLISRLAVSEITRVSVPELRVMDSRRHRIDVVVPTRLTNEQVRWRSNFAGPIEKPRWRIQPPSKTTSASNVTAEENSQDPESELSVYAVTNSRWSIDLETLPRTDRVARLLHTDHSLIVQSGSDSLVMISRFDIVPGDQPTLRLSIDRSVELQGVWAATQQADLQPVASSRADSGSRQGDAVIWEVSLPLSRLSQTVEVLTLLGRDTPDVLLPSLISLSLDAPRASVNWSQRPALHGGSARTIDEVIGGEDATSLDSDRFHNDPRAVALIASPLSPQTRLAWLASNVVKAIRASSDSLADRRDDEVAVWLGPWIARYQMLCDAAGRQIGDDDPKETASPNHSDSAQTAPSFLHLPSGHGIAPDDLLSWPEMDAYIVAQETRYFPGGTFAGGTASLSWSDDLAITKPPGYVDRWTFAWSGRRLPIQALAVQRPPLSERTRQLVMRSGLFFVLFSLLMIAALLPRRERSEMIVNDSEVRMSWADMTLNPSLWLFVLGIIGLILMPLPMALGVLVVAVVFGASQTKRWVVSQWKVSMQKRAST